MIGKEWYSPHCRPNALSSQEDMIIASCLRWNIATCKNSMDERNEPRYHPYDPPFHAEWNSQQRSNLRWKDLLTYHNVTSNQEYLHGISATSTTFHLISKSRYQDNGLRRYHALLYGLCDSAHKISPLPESEWNLTCISNQQ